MGNFCACIITTSPHIMPPKRVLPMHTHGITQPLHTEHTGHVSATFGVSIYCACRADAAPRTAPCAPHRTASTLTALNGCCYILVGLRWSLLFPDGLWMVTVISYCVVDGYRFFLMGHGWLPVFPNNSNTCTVRAPCAHRARYSL